MKMTPPILTQHEAGFPPGDDPGRSPAVVGTARCRRQALWMGRLFVVGLLLSGSLHIGRADREEPDLDVPFEGTPQPVVEEMLRLAEVGTNDVVYDLGCGDGRIVITAASKFGARGVGVDLDPQRLIEARENALREGVGDRVEFRQGDIFQVDLSGASAVTIYLLDEVNRLLRPNLFRDLDPGTPVVSHAFHMGDWDHDRLVRNTRARNKSLYVWIIPAGLGGSWDWTILLPEVELPARMIVQQEYQVPVGQLTLAGAAAPEDGMSLLNVVGREVNFSLSTRLRGESVRVDFQGRADGDQIRGTQEWRMGDRRGQAPWLAVRRPSDVAGRWQLSTHGSELELTGVLTIERTNGKLGADFTASDGAPVPKVRAAYFWGASLRLDLELATSDNVRPLIMKGLLEGDSGSGTLERDGYNGQPLRWSASRLPQERAP